MNKIHEMQDKDSKFPINEDNLNEIIKNQKFFIIAGEPGMGKSTALTHLLGKPEESEWVIRLNLINLQEHLQKIKNVNTLESVIREFFCKIDVGVKSGFSEELLKYRINNQGKITLLFDGFDEITDENQEKVIELLKHLKDTKAKIRVTTRLHVKDKLENALSAFSYTIQPFSRDNQQEFLQEFWKASFKLTFGGRINDEVFKSSLNELFEDFHRKIKDKKYEFMSTPLLTRMFAEVYQELIEKFCNPDSQVESELTEEAKKRSIWDLYEQFIERKYNIYFKEKIKVENNSAYVKDQLTKALNKDHQRLAFYKLFSKFEHVETIYKQKSLSEQNKKDLKLVGIIQSINSEGDPSFIHQTFAEHFSAKWLIEHDKKLKEERKVLRIWLFKKEFSEVIRRFFDYFLTQGLFFHRAVLEDDVSVFKGILSRNLDIAMTDSLGRTALHIAAQEGRVEIIQYLWVAGGDKLIPDQFNRTPLHYAASYGQDMIIQQLLKNHVDIDLDDHIFRTPLHFGVEIGDSLFQNAKCIKSKLVKLINQLDNAGKSSLYYAVDNERWEAACNLLLHGADSSELTEEMKQKLLIFAAGKTHGTSAYLNHQLRPIVGFLSIQVPEAIHGFSDNYQYPRLLSYFFVKGHTKVIHTLLNSIPNFERRKKIVNECDQSVTLLRYISENFGFNDDDHLKIIKYLFNQGMRHGIEIDSETAGIFLHNSATIGNLNTFKYLVERRKVPVNYPISNFTVVDRALIENHQLEILKYLWENHRKHINDSNNRTPLHMAAFSANLQAVQYLCTHGAAVNAKDLSGRTPLHYAARAPVISISPAVCTKPIGHQRVVQYLVEKQGAHINVVDKEGNTALDLSFKYQQWTVTDYLIEKHADIPSFSLTSDTERVIQCSLHDTFPLHSAVLAKNVQLIQFLLQQKKVDVNCLDQKHRTPLHYTATCFMAYHHKIVESLLCHGVQYDVRDNEKKTALDLFEENKLLLFDKSIWLLQLIEKLFHSQTLMKDLHEKLSREKHEISNQGPYGIWYPDVYDWANPMQFVLNARSVKRGTLLHIAAKTGDLAALKCLLEFNEGYLNLKWDPNYPHAAGYQAIDINAKDEYGNMPLHWAALQGCKEIIVLLLENGAIFNAKNIKEHTPKSLAKRAKHNAIVEYLKNVEDLFVAVNQGISIETENNSLQKKYVYNENSDNGKFLSGKKKLQEDENHHGKILCFPQVDTLTKALACVRDYEGKTLLHWAARRGQIEVIRAVLNLDAVINAQDNHRHTPLHEAATGSQTKAIQLLLQHGAQFNIKNKRNQTPSDRSPYQSNSLLKSIDQLFSYTKLNYPNIVIKELRCFDGSHDDLKAIMQSRDERGYTLLHWAAREHYDGVVEQLLQHGAVYDDFTTHGAEVLNYERKTPRNFGQNHRKITDLFQLIEEWMCDETPPYFSIEELSENPHRLNIIKNARNRAGETPLHVNRNYFRLNYLIREGADLMVRDKDGNTPLHAAVERDDIAAVKLFLDHGADVNAENNRNQKPLNLSNNEVLTTLLQKFNECYEKNL